MPTLSNNPNPHSIEQAKYRRYNVLTDNGQAMLASYKKGIQAMLNLSASDRRNWFRHAFIHFFDCPHGNWWFPVWHRAYLYWFENIIRKLSGDILFTLPYWDWTEYPEIPASMFDGVLTPTDKAYLPYTQDEAVFTDFIKPSLASFWSSMGTMQDYQMELRGYKSFNDMWQAVLGYNGDKKDPGSEAFATTDNSRYLTLVKRSLDKRTKSNVSLNVINDALAPQEFYSPDTTLSFTSAKTDSHVVMPKEKQFFSILEGQPHNSVHNCIGGVGPLDPGPYAYMANFLSPVDPIFFLHHANIDRLSDVWARKQESLNLPDLPMTMDDRIRYKEENFYFFTDESGNPIISAKAISYHYISTLQYDYEPGSGENIINTSVRADLSNSYTYSGKTNGYSMSIQIPSKFLDITNETNKSLVVTISFNRPDEGRGFDILVNAPQGMTTVDTNSPYYGGTVVFFGPPMSGMTMSNDTAFTLILPQTLEIFHTAYADEFATLVFTLVPSVNTPGEQPLIIQTLTVRAL